MPDRDPRARPVTVAAAHIDALLESIERERTPERLMELARELQDALRARASGADRKS
ncbi:hypothetical protein HNP73_003410 [Amaricoccus macauensis]|uniref:Uncharacterized protein n=1 Tax=Amaricoccus macauensis TaxID=57001 RepID=A0A840SW31_9RHOB|nr:hypothetical protein [Amaricoccus macauensis]MBB5223463.1 hypothetical protein [Amaricoccus macauensis]